MNRIHENDIVLPALFFMSKQNGMQITTTKLKQFLLAAMHPQGEDALILNGRNDSRFTQIVRNLKSHDTLERLKFATYDNGRFTITCKGLSFVEKNIDSIEYLINEGFAYDDMREAFKTIAEHPKEKIIPFNEIIAEGITVKTTNKRVQRSQKLRASALEFYSNNGHIVCDCCGFDFKTAYAPDYECECIEIHHKKPIFLYGINDVQNTIDEALQNLMPVCPNCHRVIHKMNIGSEQFPAFKKFIKIKLHAHL
jgi:hypothetical protein